jgi:hypothetical protein
VNDDGLEICAAIWRLLARMRRNPALQFAAAMRHDSL